MQERHLQGARHAEARRGGRILTTYINRMLERDARGAFWPDMRQVLAGNPVTKAGEPISADSPQHFTTPEEAVQWIWETWLAGTRDSLQAKATAMDLDAESALLHLQAAEAMAGWPVYRAALAARREL